MQINRPWPLIKHRGSVAHSLATLTLLLATGCGNPFATQSGAETQDTQPSTDRGLVTTSAPSPTRVAIFLDKTGSVKESGVEQVQADDLKPLIEHLRRHGGEIGIGFIRDRSDRPLLRLRIDTPPVAPTEPSDIKNPFERANRMATYQEERKRYEEELEDWDSQTSSEIDRYLSVVAKKLGQKADAQRTDFWGAVRRANLFLRESDASWAHPTKRFAIFITDGEDNVKTPAELPASGAMIILVNASTSVAALEKLNPVYFDSARAAFRFVVAEGAQ